MEIEFKTKLHNHIADLMWEADDDQKVKDIIKVYGVDGQIVYNMIMAAFFDEVMDTDIAEAVLKKYTKKKGK